MSEVVVREAGDGFMARALYHGHQGVRDRFKRVFGVFPDGNPQPRAASYDEDGAVVIGLEPVYELPRSSSSAFSGQRPMTWTQ